MPWKDHFSAGASGYAAHRPTYPPALAAWLAGISPGHALAWDCGTGSGQAAVLLGAHFARVVATDASAQQIAHAVPHSHVEYRVGLESASGLDAGSCDVVTCAQAAHWLDLTSFYAEVERVLRPRGVLAVWGYARTRVDVAVDRVIDWFQDERVGPYWPAGREHVDAEYRTIAFPYERLDAPPFEMARRWDLRQLLAYVGTWSSVVRCREVEGTDPVDELARALAPVWPDPSDVRDVRSPIFMLAARPGAQVSSAHGSL